MPIMQLKLGPEPHWPELLKYKLVTPGDAHRKVKVLYHLQDDAPPIQVARLPGGMVSGKSSVAIRIDLPDGRVVVAETSLALFLGAARVFQVRENMENPVCSECGGRGTIHENSAIACPVCTPLDRRGGHQWSR